MQQMIINMTAFTVSNNNVTENLYKINETLTNISAHVIEPQNKDKEKSRQINEMEMRVKNVEQKMIERNTEIMSK